jgi:DNA polymerase (family 10)
VEEMAHAAKDRGYRYMAICDHSPAVAVTHGLGAERLLRQQAEIARLNGEFRDFRILSGVEVDIRSNGRLDLDDEILEQLELVVASIHSGFTQSEKEITARIVKAIENPHVDMIAHLTGRLIGRREPYPVDMDRIMDACKANETILELNAYPERLDLSDLNCRRAKEKGVRIAISTDSHRIRHLDMMHFGIATARRGWLEPRDVVNTLPLNRLLKLLKH